MAIPVTTRIDAEKCIGCGLCLRVCPSDTLSIVNEKAVVTGTDSLGCDHCAAVCPAKAVTVGFVDEESVEFRTFESDPQWQAPGKADLSQLVHVMQSRRSCRNYTDKPVDRAILEDLVKIGISAPSGTNSQLWTFTLVPDRNAVEKMGESCLGFFKKLNRMAINPGMRLVAKFFMKDALNIYYENYYEKVELAIREWEKDKTDRLFHGASAAILIGMRPGASCPVEDALLASQNILLAAHAMGLGTCLIGFAVEAIKRDGKVKRALGIPESEEIHAAIALGWPDEKYRRVAGRHMPPIRTYQG